jgi:hypothetical protein
MSYFIAHWMRQRSGMFEHHPEIAHINPAATRRALHEMVELALRHPALRLAEDGAATDRRQLHHHRSFRTPLNGLASGSFF